MGNVMKTIPFAQFIAISVCFRLVVENPQSKSMNHPNQTTSERYNVTRL